jgi:hypothetical protein
VYSICCIGRFTVVDTEDPNIVSMSYWEMFVKRETSFALGNEGKNIVITVTYLNAKCSTFGWNGNLEVPRRFSEERMICSVD